MAYSAGTAFLQVEPSFEGLEAAIARMSRDMVKSLDKQLSEKLGKAVQGATRSAERDAGKAGQALGKTFIDGALRQVNAGVAAISETDRVLAPLRKELVAISEIDLGKGFNEKDFIARIQRVSAALRKAQADAQGPKAVSRFTEAGNAAALLGSVEDLVRAARERGFVSGDAFVDAYQSRLKAMRRALPDLRIRAESTDAERAAAPIRQRIEDAARLKAGDAVTRENNPLNLPIGVRISRQDLAREMSIIEGLIDNFVERFGDSDLVLPFDKARRQAAGFFEDVKTESQKATEDVARDQQRADEQNRKLRLQQTRREFEERAKLLRAAREEELREERRIAQQNAALRAAQARREIEERARQLRAAREIERRDEQRAADQRLAAARREMEQRQRLLEQERARLAAEARRAFGQTTAGEAQQRLGSAADRIVELPVHLQANSVDREMADIRRRIKALGDVQIGVDLDAEGFADQVQAEFTKLESIAHDRKVDIEVRTDAARAASELGAILVLLNRIDNDKATVEVDANSFLSSLRSMGAAMSLNLGRLGALIALGASLGTAIVPAAAAAASAIGSIGTAALAAGAGIGVMIIGFSGVGEAVKLMGQVADQQAKSGASLARSANQVEAAQSQIRSAEMALADTRRDNATAALRAQRAIRDALDDQRDAVREVARANQDATLRLTDAQRDATRAVLDEQRARDRLTESYRDARRALEDLSSQVRGNALDQRQAVLDITEAKEELDKLLVNPRASAAEREQAQITYEQRLLQMEDLKRRGAELSEAEQERLRKGIAGSDEVLRARRELADAEQRRTATQRELTRAQEDLVETQLDGTRRLRDAEQKVLDSRAAAAEQQRDAADAEYQATQQIVAARRALENATNASAVAGGAALTNLQTHLDNMTPAARALAEYLYGMRDAWQALKVAASPVAAGMQAALESMLGGTSEEAIKRLQPLLSFVNRVAQELGRSFQRFAATLQGPEFREFFDYIDQTAVPTLRDMYTIFENFTVGFVNLFLAFTPLTGDVNKGFLGMSESFREWTSTLGENEAFQEFLAYLRESGPQIARFLGEAAKAIGSLVAAAAPVGSAVVDAFIKVFEWINKIPQDTLTALVAGIAAAAGALALFAGATAIAALDTAGLIAAAIAAVVVGLTGLVGSSEGAMGALGTAWKAIKEGATVAFGAIKEALLEAWRAVQPTLARLGEMFTWLWHEAIVPAAEGIWAVIKQLYETLSPIFDLIISLIKPLATIIWWLLKNVIIPVVAAIVVVLVKTLVPVIKWLWTNIFKPILQSIGLAFSIGAAIIKVAVGVILVVLKALGWMFSSLWNDWIKPFWEKHLKPLISRLSGALDPVKSSWKNFVRDMGKLWRDLGRLVRTPIKFIVETLLNDGLLKGYNWLADKFDIEPKNVKIPPPSGGWDALYATGGAVYGPGTGTSDSIRARLSKGEHVLTAKEVEAAGGHRVIYALRRAILSGGLLPGFAGGGPVTRRRPGTGDGIGDWLKRQARGLGRKATDAFSSAADFFRNPLGSLTDLARGLFDKIPGKDMWFVQKLISLPQEILGSLKDKVRNLFLGGDEGLDGATAGAVHSNSNRLGGSAGMIGILRQVFPGLNLNSGYRPGAITVGGNPSMHGRNRAVDVPPRRDVFEWIRANYPDSFELIFSPAGNRQLYKGRPHVFSDAVRNIHWDHVHWSYDEGGELPDTRRMPGGVMQVFHGKRTPDKVLTDVQWTNIARLARATADRGGGGGDTYNFEFANSTLTAERVMAIQARRDALDRVSRDNW